MDGQGPPTAPNLQDMIRGRDAGCMHKRIQLPGLRLLQIVSCAQAQGVYIW